MSINIPRLIDEYFSELLVSNRKSNGTVECSPNHPEAEFDTNGVQRDWRGDERLDQDPAGKIRNNI